MIASKLIFFFCFYLLLDNSLGQKTLVTQGKNKKLFENAIGFGDKFGGELGELGSQWKQLLIELVQVHRKVGLSKYQLARFNDTATEEVGLAINDNYSDKVAELVAMRTQDIGTTQKYVEDLDILKDEIALTMIVKMEKIEEEFKEKNVRKKVKEAKENGITDTDIKELLFAEFFDSGGLSLIGAAASTAHALLSSLRKGMEFILAGNFYKEFGIIQYANGRENDASVDGGGDSGGGGASVGAPDDGGDDVPEGGGAAGGASGGGGSGGHPPDGPPTGPPSSADDLDDSNEPDEDKQDDKNETETYVYVNGIRYTSKEAEDATRLVEAAIDEFERRVGEIESRISDVQMDLNEYEANTSFQLPQDRDLYQTERLNLYNRRIEALSTMLLRLSDVIDDNAFYRFRFNVANDFTIQNYDYYTRMFSGDPRAQMPSAPHPLPEFENINAEGEDNVNRIRYYIVRLRRTEMYRVSTRYDGATRTLSHMNIKLTKAVNAEKEKIRYETKPRYEDVD